MKAEALAALQSVRTLLAYQLTPEAVSELLEPIQELLNCVFVSSTKRDSHAWCDECKSPPAASCYSWCPVGGADRVTAYQENGMFCVTYRTQDILLAKGAHEEMKRFKSLMDL